MPRSTRIEYENAYYHVMNRGRGRQLIFHADQYYQCFLEAMSEAHQRFGLLIHSYCLMSNHYHLFVSTPRSNLGRCMRHINGIYTQRYNRLKKTDGPLFRGRYKAILVQADNYFLQLSRYIHRNPIETKTPMVEELAQYPWSSYPAYINQVSSPDWLERDTCYSMLGNRQRYKGYKTFVEMGNDPEITLFYAKKTLKPILGNDSFVENFLQQKNENAANQLAKSMGNLPTIDAIVAAVSAVFNQSIKSIVHSHRGRGSKNIARWVAIVLCLNMSGQPLSNLAKAFHIKHISGLNQAKKKLGKELVSNLNLAKKLKLLSQQLTR